MFTNSWMIGEEDEYWIKIIQDEDGEIAFTHSELET